jgi:hypothetical protein
MKVAVITPYYDEDEAILDACHQSVLKQTHPSVHFMISDGRPHPSVSRWNVVHVQLPTAHGDNGDTPRCVGAVLAACEGFDAVAFLDADNWLQIDHVESLVTLARRTSAPVCVSSRSIHRFDGSLMIDRDRESDGEAHVDTSCLLITRPAFGSLPVWGGIPRIMSPVCDRIFWRHILHRRYGVARTGRPTVAFRTRYTMHYDALGETPPAGSKHIHEHYRWWRSLTPEQIIEVVSCAETYSAPNPALIERLLADLNAA